MLGDAKVANALFRERTGLRSAPTIDVSFEGVFRYDRGGRRVRRTLYPGTAHFPFDTSCEVRSSMSGLAAATSSYNS